MNNYLFSGFSYLKALTASLSHFIPKVDAFINYTIESALEWLSGGLK